MMLFDQLNHQTDTSQYLPKICKQQNSLKLNLLKKKMKLGIDSTVNCDSALLSLLYMHKSSSAH